MIELYTFISLLGIGYLLTKTNTVPNKQPVRLNVNEMPSMNNVYDSSYVNVAKQQEAQKAKKAFENASNPNNAKVIGNTFREEQDFKNRNHTIKSNLAGIEIPEDQFMHNNMVPFFGSRIKQNVEPVANRSVLETFTGEFGKDIYRKKKEQPPLFGVQENIQNVFGNTSQTDYYKDRIVAPRLRNNEKPFESLQVGPGLGNGFSASPTGGYQQYETREYAMPKNVDELRKGSNPKESYEARILPGMGTAQRGQVGDVKKNKNVVTFFENSEDRYFTTTGAYKKDTERPEYEVKDTSRTHTTREYKGDAFLNSAQKVDSAVKDSTRQQFTDFGFRNVDGQDYGQGEEYDYGKKNILVSENERDLTLEKTYEGNITSLVKSIIAPLEDIFRNSRKEYIVQNPRAYGQFQATFPQKITIKDPNDVTRTTIKETLLHDTVETGNLRGAVKIAVYDPEDIARRTVRETTKSMDTKLNVRGGKISGTVHHDDKPSTTIKETTIDGERYGNVESMERKHGGYQSTEYDAKLTQKQFISDRDYTGIVDHGKGDGYKISPAEAPTTQKEFLSDHDYVGNALSGESKKPMSYEDIMNATINEVRESTLEGREPTKESVKVASGVDDVNITYKKIEADDYASRENNNIEHVMNKPKSHDEFVLTKHKDQLDNDDRLDINVLSSLRTNPYALGTLGTE